MQKKQITGFIVKTNVMLIQDRLSQEKISIRKHLPLIPWNKQYGISYDGKCEDVNRFFLLVGVGDVIGIDGFYMKVTYKLGMEIKGDKLNE